MSQKYLSRPRTFKSALAIAIVFSFSAFAAESPLETQLKLDLALKGQFATSKAIHLGLACHVPMQKMQGIVDLQNASRLTVPSSYYSQLESASNRGIQEGKLAGAKLTPSQCGQVALRLSKLSVDSAKEAAKIKADVFGKK